mgnify:CR=1 FL=1|jgi:rsbT co-antagonist protein RsbR
MSSEQELEALRKRVAELEQLVQQQQLMLTQNQHLNPTPQQTMAQLQAWLEVLPDPTLITDFQGTIVLVNNQIETLFGFTQDELLGQKIEVLVPSNVREAHVHMRNSYAAEPHRRAMASGLDLRAQHKDGRSISVEISLSPIDTALGKMVISSIRDITERRRIEAEHSQLQADIIRMQKMALDELSTPLLPISDDILVMPLIGSIDSRRAQQMIETLLHGIIEHRAAIALIDITGVTVCDTHVAGILVRCTQAAKMLGTQTVITGIRPEVAQTLVGLGMDLSGVMTLSTLQSGVAYAMQQRRHRASGSV